MEVATSVAGASDRNAITKIIVLREEYPFKETMVRVNNTLLVHPEREKAARTRYPHAVVENARGLPPPKLQPPTE